MTRTGNLIVITIVTITLACVFYLFVNNATSKRSDPIFQSAEVSENSNKELSIDTRTNKQKTIRKETTLENNLINDKFTIDLQLSKDLADALLNNNKQEKLLELIRLADNHSDNLLLQYLAATNCLEQFKIFCNVEEFSQRILSQNQSNATAKSLIAAMHLHNNDEESMLDALKEIGINDKYNSFFYELTQSLEPAFEAKVKEKYSLAMDQLKPMIEKELNYYLENKHFDKILNNAVQKGIFEKTAENTPNTDAYLTCMNKLSFQDSIEQRWIKPCSNLAKSMATAETHMSQAAGYSLQKIIYKLQNDKINLKLVESLENNSSLIYTAATQLLNSNDFFLNDEFDLYYAESIALGEIEAMKNLLQRQQKSNSPP